jgi:hypothetical protein
VPLYVPRMKVNTPQIHFVCPQFLARLLALSQSGLIQAVESLFTPMAAVGVSRDVCSTLNFISPNSDFNRRYMAPMSEINTGVYEEHQIMIKDARCNPADFTLEKNGFTLVTHKSKVQAKSVWALQTLTLGY